MDDGDDDDGDDDDEQLKWNFLTAYVITNTFNFKQIYSSQPLGWTWFWMWI